MSREISFFLSTLLIRGNGKSCGKNLGQQRAPYSSLVTRDFFTAFAIGVYVIFLDPYRDFRIQLDYAAFISTGYLANVGKHQALAASVDFFPSCVIKPQNDVLRRHDNRFSVRRRQNVIRGHHQRPALHLRFERQRHMHRHLVTVEVGVECRAYQGMQLYRLAFDQHRFECLNAQSVQRRSPVQHYRMFANHILKDIPDHRGFIFDFALGCLDGAGDTHYFKLVEYERLEQFQRHFLRQAALMQFKLRAHHNH